MSKEGVRPLQGKVEAIRSFPQPKTMKQLRRFLGMINFYRRFVSNAARTLQPLEQLLSPHKNSRKGINWDENTSKAFTDIKGKLADVAWLTFPVMGAQTNLVTDASGTAVAGVLQQVIDGEAKPLAFFSKSIKQGPTKLLCL